MSTVKLKRSATASKIPLTTDLDLGEIAINTFDGKLFIKKNNGTESIVEIGAGGGGGSQAWILKSANYTAVSGDKIIANTTAASFTITLPATPTTGAYVQITDGGNWSVNNLLINRNAPSTIEGIADTLAIDLAKTTVEFIYDGTTWQFTA